MKFYKVHALGSDYVLFDGRDADELITDDHPRSLYSSTPPVMRPSISPVVPKWMNLEGKSRNNFRR